MNKKLILLFASIILTKSVSAQDSDKKFHFGLKAAPGLYWFKAGNKQTESNGSKIGFTYGAMLEFALTDNYAFVTGLDVSYVGGKSIYTLAVEAAGITTTTTVKSDLRAQYLQLPALLKMKTKEIGMIRYFGQFGFNTALLLKATSDYSVSTTTGATNTTAEGNDEDVKKSMNPIRLSLNIGGGLEYNLSGSTSIVGSIAFENGFLNVTDDSDNKILSKGIVLTVGILF